MLESSPGTFLRIFHPSVLIKMSFSALNQHKITNCSNAKSRQGKARQVYLYSTIQRQGDSKCFTETLKQKK